uniref:Macrophage migration inhibitory factor n=1 Tax=Panagrolaimus sp. PS1159 TaxID=55785 RepID=A0AC35F2E9_9BILA
MPFVKLVTNVPEEKIPQDFNQKFNRLLADIFPGKSYEVFAIDVISNKRYTFGGTSEPSAMLKITAFHIFSPEKNVKYSKAICEFLFSTLQIPGTRILIEFIDIATCNVGFNSSTVQALIDEGNFTTSK